MSVANRPRCTANNETPLFQKDYWSKRSMDRPPSVAAGSARPPTGTSSCASSVPSSAPSSSLSRPRCRGGWATAGRPIRLLREGRSPNDSPQWSCRTRPDSAGGCCALTKPWPSVTRRMRKRPSRKTHSLLGRLLRVEAGRWRRVRESQGGKRTEQARDTRHTPTQHGHLPSGWSPVSASSSPARASSRRPHLSAKYHSN